MSMAVSAGPGKARFDEIPMEYVAVFAGFIGKLGSNAGDEITSVNGVLFTDAVPIITFVISAVFRSRGACMTCSTLIFNNCIYAIVPL